MNEQEEINRLNWDDRAEVHATGGLGPVLRQELAITATPHAADQERSVGYRHVILLTSLNNHYADHRVDQNLELLCRRSVASSYLNQVKLSW